MASDTTRASIATFRAQYPGTLDYREAIAFLGTTPTTFAVLKQRYHVRTVARSHLCALYAVSDLQGIQAAEQHAHATQQARTLRNRGIYLGAPPPGRQVGHCGRWQAVTTTPHVCVICQARVFEEEPVT